MNFFYFFYFRYKPKTCKLLKRFVSSFQISLLQTMQSKYAKLEYDHARSLWINYRHGGAGDADGEFEYEATFSTLVEQVIV